MNHDYLKAEYERHPERWAIERYSGICWVPIKVPKACLWLSGTRYRLRPVVPDSLPALPDAAYCYGPDKPGAVFLGKPLKMPSPQARIVGWAVVIGSRWEYSTNWSGDGCNGFGPYLLDLAGSNAEAILELNKPDLEVQVDKLYEGLAKQAVKDWFDSISTEKHMKNLNNEETNRLIANTATLSGALAQAGGDPEMVLDRDEVRDLLRTLARNNIELRAVYSGKRGAS